MKKLNCILLIDDSEEDNLYHKIIITKAGVAVQIKTVSTGTQALEYLKNTKHDPAQYPIPDLIFLDINMPGMNGFEFLEAVRKQKVLHEGISIVVIMLTTSVNPADRKNAEEKFSAELKGFYNKPLTGEMLHEILENYF